MSHVIERIFRNPSKLLTIEGWGKAFRHIGGLSRRWRKRIVGTPSKNALKYATYDEYVAHQRSKLDEMISKGTAVRDPRALEDFKTRFSFAPLPAPSTILCLGARLGSEVEAFISFGHVAIGIDLNPGANNPYVMAGDFHALQFADASFDCVYTNSLDHAFELNKIAAEVRRVLKPNGLFLLEAVYGTEEGYKFGARDHTRWKTAQGFAEKIAALGGFAIESGIDLTRHGTPQWWQFSLRKSHAG